MNFRETKIEWSLFGVARDVSHEPEAPWRLGQATDCCSETLDGLLVATVGSVDRGDEPQSLPLPAILDLTQGRSHRARTRGVAQPGLGCIDPCELAEHVRVVRIERVSAAVVFERARATECAERERDCCMDVSFERRPRLLRGVERTLEVRERLFVPPSLCESEAVVPVREQVTGTVARRPLEQLEGSLVLALREEHEREVRCRVGIFGHERRCPLVRVARFA